MFTPPISTPPIVTTPELGHSGRATMPPPPPPPPPPPSELGHRRRASWPPLPIMTTPEQPLISTPPIVTTPEQPLISTPPIVTTPELGHGGRATMPPPPPIDIEKVSTASTTPGKSKSWVYYIIKEDEEKKLSMCMLCGSYTKCRDNINLSNHLSKYHPYEAWQAYTTYKMLCVIQS